MSIQPLTTHLVPHCQTPQNLSLIPPPYLYTSPGFACVVSTNFTTTSSHHDVLNSSISSDSSNSLGNESIFQTCCGIDSPIARFGDAGCGFAYCNVTDGKAGEGFVACFNATADGVRGRCFESLVGKGEGSGDGSGDGSGEKGGVGRMRGLGSVVLVVLGIMGGLVMG